MAWRSVLRALGSFLPLGRSKEVPAEVDWTPFRVRAMELLDMLVNGSQDDQRLDALRSVGEKLALLVEEMKRHGIPRRRTRPLEKIVQQIQALLAKPIPLRSHIAKLWLRTEAVLREFFVAEHGR